MMFYYILRCSWNLLPKLFYVLTVNNGSRKIALEENCLISPNSNANPKPNPDPDRGSIFLGDNFPDTVNNVLNIDNKNNNNNNNNNNTQIL